MLTLNPETYEEIPQQADSETADTKRSHTRLRKLSNAMELIRQAFSLETPEMLCVMGTLLDYVQKVYPEKAKLISAENED